jgi:tRNA threonylcarbamoyl adenosine modification protein YeaZ
MQIVIDTSTETAGLALMQDGEILAELSWRCRQNHTTQLLPRLSRLVELAGLKMDSADCIIVARGPGSYNGLRVGVSTAKGLAFALNIPIVGVSTLEAEAFQHAETGLPVCPVFNAGKEELATATFQKTDGQWLQLREPRLTTIETLCEETITETVFCGEFVPSVAGILKEKLQGKAVILSPAANLRRPAYLAELGLKRYKAGDLDDAASLQPFYFRGPSISQPKHR